MEEQDLYEERSNCKEGEVNNVEIKVLEHKAEGFRFDTM